MGKLVPLQHGRTNGELLHRAARNPSLPLESELDEESEAVQLAAVAVAEAARHIARTHAPCGRLPAAVLGHSLGGKIALRYLRIAAAAAAAAGDGDDRYRCRRGRWTRCPRRWARTTTRTTCSA
jgi:pimeloyl-ACP methyl ester carboxylesterase